MRLKNLIKSILIMTIILFTVSCGNNNTGYFINNTAIQEGDNDFYKKEDEIKNIEEKLRVALLIPLSGPVKNIGEGILNSIQLSIFNNNKKNIILKIYDTEGTTFGAVNAINKAMKDGIDVVIGPLFGVETKAIYKIARDNNILLFSLSNDQDLVNTDNVFITGSIPQQEIETLVSYMFDNDFYNYIALMPNTTHGALMNKLLRKSLTNKDGLLIKTEYYEQNDNKLLSKIIDLINFYEIPTSIYENYEKTKLEQKLAGVKDEIQFKIGEDQKIYPQALFIPEGGKTAEQIANLLYINQNSNRYIQLVGTTKLDGDSNSLSNPYLNNVIFVGAHPEKYKKFSDDYFKNYHIRPIKISSMTYDLINIIDQVYKKHNGMYIPSKEILLNPEGFDGIDGKFRFLPNGLVERKMYILQLQSGKKVIINTNQEFLNY